MKAFTFPQDPKWCVYLNSDSRPYGDIGHICKSFEKTSNIFSAFYFINRDLNWSRSTCAQCSKDLPEELKKVVKFLLL